MGKLNKQHAPRAASFKRIAKALRVRARNHYQAAKKITRQHGLSGPHLALHEREQACGEVYTGIARELDAEAKLLRSMR